MSAPEPPFTEGQARQWQQEVALSRQLVAERPHLRVLGGPGLTLALAERLAWLEGERERLRKALAEVVCVNALYREGPYGRVTWHEWDGPGQKRCQDIARAALAPRVTATDGGSA